ncbi:hypothetical protein ACRS8P_00870 [Burkholderia cenocepacia]
MSAYDASADSHQFIEFILAVRRDCIPAGLHVPAATVIQRKSGSVGVVARFVQEGMAAHFQ